MKPTSLIFLALAAVLLFSGWFTCSIATSMADAQGVKIFEQKTDRKGDTVYVYNLSEDQLTKLSLNFDDVDVSIVGSAKSSYVELRNFDPYDYSTTLTGGTVTVDGTVGGLSSLIDMSGGGLRFKGLRYFFADKPAVGHKRSVTIYISDVSSLKTLNLTLKKGNVTLENIYNTTVDYNINVTEGNLILNTVQTESVMNLRVNAGDLTVTNSKFTTMNTDIVGGNMTIDMTLYAAEFVSYNVKTENSALTHNDVLIADGQLKIATPAEIQKSLVKIDATDAVVYIKDNNTPAQP